MRTTFSSAIAAAFPLLVQSACTPLVTSPRKQVVEPNLIKDYFVASDGSLLPLRSWLPQDGPVKAVLIALHGFNDYSNFFISSGNYLCQFGIACFAYDQRGFGEAPVRGLWSGTEAYTNDLSNFVREIRNRHQNVTVYVLGESMGGAVAIVTMTGSTPPDVDGIILVAPAVWGRETMPWYQKTLLSIASYTIPWMTLTGKIMNRLPSDNREMLRALGRDPHVIKATRIDTIHGLADLMDEALSRADKLRLPTLVLYGRNDQIIPKLPIMLMLGKMPPSTKKAFYEHGYHLLLRDIHGEKPLADIAAWLANHDAPLPYGMASLD